MKIIEATTIVKMSIELQDRNTVAFRVTNEFENFCKAYIKDRFTICSLLSYTRKVKVYLAIPDTTHIHFQDYISFASLLFKTFEGGAYFFDEPFKLVSVATIVKILDELELTYKVDNVGLFTQVA